VLRAGLSRYNLLTRVKVGRVKLTGMAEVFNLSDYARYNRNTILGNALFGQPISSAGMPRTGQLAFKISFQALEAM
jgi:hypothetical protein